MIELTTKAGTWFVNEAHIVDVEPAPDEMTEGRAIVQTITGEKQRVEEEARTVAQKVNVETAVLHR